MTKEQLIIDKALELGFSECAIIRTGQVDSCCETTLKEWLEGGNAAEMNYMHNNLEKRLNPGLLVDDCRSMIIVALNYYPQIKRDTSFPEISYYAYGKDYHDIIKSKLRLLWEFISESISPLNGRIFTDSAPVLERYWAAKAGLGFIGKSNNLIIPGKGSFFFLGEIICDLDLEPASSVSDSVNRSCGNCRRCIEACPAGALKEDGDTHCLDARKCISYQTIENKGDIDPSVAEKIGNRLYGCDTCLKVCPFNRFATPTAVEEFMPSEEFLSLDYEKLESLTETEFKVIFRGSPIKRAGFSGIKRNLACIDNKFY